MLFCGKESVRTQGAGHKTKDKRQKTKDCTTARPPASAEASAGKARQIMTYKETLEFLYSQLPAYHRIGKAAYKNDLNNTKELDAYFGSPHRKYRTIHVAGTNGKGSVSHITASMLQEAGYKTGLYTSPHLRDFRERIRVDGEMIPENEVVAFVDNHRDLLEKLSPSFFEMSVAMAFDYFERCRVDVAVIEVGLGGRLDSTNIISPVLSVITNIGHDHMDLLGDTLEKVASEKAGIIKDGIPVVIGETHEETKDVFIEKAGVEHAEIFFADRNYSCILGEMDMTGQGRKFDINETGKPVIFHGLTPLGGDYQKANLQTIAQVYTCLRKSFRIAEEHFINGIRNVVKNTGLQGRWQILRREPLVICDTGHNLEGLKYVIKQVLELPAVTRHFVLGFVSDKDIASVLPLFPQDAVYYFTKAKVPRAMDEKRLKDAACKFGLTGECYATVAEAYEAAVKNAKPIDIVFIGGSTFVVAEVI